MCQNFLAANLRDQGGSFPRVAQALAGRFRSAACRRIGGRAARPQEPGAARLPRDAPGRQYKAATHAQLDQIEEARAAVAEALKLDPTLMVEGEHARRLAMGLAPANAVLLSAALRRAGLPQRKAAQGG